MTDPADVLVYQLARMRKSGRHQASGFFMGDIYQQVCPCIHIIS